jgi:hypothetical protein
MSWDKDGRVKKGFLICPVRGIDPEESRLIVESIESEGIDLHWPHRDTNQNDDLGYEICTQNKQAIIDADVVYIMWDGNSQGCLFDLGIAFALNRKIEIVALPPATSHKSFQNMVNVWAELD